MKECVYCGNEIKGNGTYFCEKCKREIKESQHVNTGHVMGDWVAKAYWYLEENGGNYWRNLSDFEDSPKEEQELMSKFMFIRPVDFVRFMTFVKATGKVSKIYAMSASHLNDMEKWYMNLAEKYMQENPIETIDDDMILCKNCKYYVAEEYKCTNESGWHYSEYLNAENCYCSYFELSEDK